MESSRDWHPTTLDEVRATLGEPESSFGPDWGRLWLGILVAGLICVFGIALLGGVLDELFGSDLIKYTVGISFALFGSVALWQINRAANFQLLIYPESIILRVDRQVSVIPWNSITEVSQTANLIGTGLLVQRQHAPRIRFETEFVKHPRELLARLGSEARRRGFRFQVAGVLSGIGRGSAGRARQLALPTIESSVDLSVFGESIVQILKSSERWARKLQHDCLATEHVLLALLEGAPNSATNALQRCGVSPSSLKDRLETMIPPGPAPIDLEKLPQTPRLIDAFLMAEQEAALVGGCVAVLLGLVREQEGIAGVVLAAAGVTELKLRDAIGVSI
jgi:Clp amino terminal domain, pathogenicity island component